MSDLVNRQKVMRQILFMSLFLTAIGCTKKDTIAVRTTDPIIGEWAVELYNAETVGELEIAYRFEGSLFFYEDGTALQLGALYFDGNSQPLSQPFEWVNRKTDPDFNANAQSYLIDGVINFVVFAEDFNYATVTDEEGDTIEVFRN